MSLHTLLPRPLDPETGPESPAILTALLSGIHLDRRQARALGWRGVRPSALHGPAWTCRVAPLPHIFGLVFLDECTQEESLHGTFAAYVFPAAQDALLDSFPLRALEIALGPDYTDAVRELSAHAEALAPFCLGQVDLAAARDGSWLSLALSAPARLRLVSRGGVPVPPGAAAQGAPQWLVPPGGLECDVPAFRLLVRLFAALAGTAARLLDAEPDVRLHHTAPASPDEAAAHGEDRQLHLSASFGSAPRAATAPGKRLASLPGRYVPRPDELSCLPVMHVLTGFLGSGKTTFLRRWLDFLNGRERYASVIQNEFGQVGLDAALTRSETRVEALDEGCVCCTLADALRPGLQRLLADAPAEQVILETTGLANPGNVLRSLDDLAEFVQPGLVITVVDSLEWHRGGYATQGVSGVRLSQVQQADVIIANKADTLAEKDFEDILRTLRACNAKACILPAVQGNIAFARLDAFLADWQDARTRPPSRQPRLPTLAQARGALGTHADEGFASHTLPMQAPVDENALRRMLDAAGPGLCRAKGIVDLLHAGGVVPAVVQYAAGQLEFEAAPQDEDARYLVFIGIDLAPREAVATARGGAVAASPAA